MRRSFVISSAARRKRRAPSDPEGSLSFRSMSRVCAGASPDDDDDRPCKRGEHKAEVDPCPISLGGRGKHEKMDHNPETHRESQSNPNQIAGGFVYGTKGFALGAANADRHGHERPDEDRAKKDCQYSQPHRDGRCRRLDPRWTWLLWFGAHSLQFARKLLLNSN